MGNLLEPKQPQGIAFMHCDEDQASRSLRRLEWKIGIDGRRTHLDLGFEQIHAGGTLLYGMCR